MGCQPGTVAGFTLKILFDTRTLTIHNVRNSDRQAPMLKPSTTVPSQPSPFVEAAISWWRTECGDWDALVEAPPVNELPGGNSLWGGMPAVDSKAVARLSPIFEQHFGVPLDTKHIQPGGYRDIGVAARDLETKFKASVSQGRRVARR
jgi:hypothetical protein